MNQSTPRWLTFLLILVALAVLGPVALPFLVAALAIAVSLGVTLLKVGGVLLALYLVVTLLRGLGGRRTLAPPVAPPRASLESVEARLAEDERLRRAALDRELALALQRARQV